MPRVLVVTNNHDRTLMDEEVVPEHLDTEHSAEQLIERLAWGIEDAVCAENGAYYPEAHPVAHP